MINIFIGYDSKEKIAYHVLSESILRNSTEPVKITPVFLKNIKNFFQRERNQISSTEFSFSRFVVPYLMNYEGWGLFMDCDMLMQADIAELWKLREPKYAVQLCKHDYIPKNKNKFLNQSQTIYEKKNWSSFMLMNSEKCKKLTPEYINIASGLELHQFKWLESESLIGSLPLEWNWLVGEYPYKENVKNIHYTEGGPYFKKSSNCDYAKDWFHLYKDIIKADII
jgi:lipopolysaccharide biosynthesis glycosyltransferase